MQQRLNELQDKIQYKFRDQELLSLALTHSSFSNEIHLPKHKCNERLEFLGDAVLELISSEFLFCGNRKVSEGELTRMRASMVCEPALAFCRLRQTKSHLKPVLTLHHPETLNVHCTYILEDVFHLYKNYALMRILRILDS